MIGNDIVDLTEALKSQHWNNHRFIDKVFSIDEKDLILHASNRFQVTWILWSMKESAYKVHLRKFRKPFFAPSKINCQYEPGGSGKVRIDRTTYSTNTFVNEDLIYTIAFTDPSSEYLGGYQKVVDTSYTNLHNKCYREVIEKSSAHLNEKIYNMQIRKDEYGIPKLFANNKEQSLIFSTSHHGKYYAYVILK